MLARSLTRVTTTPPEQRREERRASERRRPFLRSFFGARPAAAGGGGGDVATCGMSSGRIVQVWGPSLPPSGRHCPEAKEEIGVEHEDDDVSLPACLPALD